MDSLARLSVSAVVLLVLSGCSGSSDSKAGPGTTIPTGRTNLGGENETTIMGRVIDDEAVPVKGALIRIDLTAPGVQTDGEGRYVFEKVPPAIHRIDVDIFGYYNQTKYVRIRDGETQVVDFKLNPIIIPSPYNRTYQHPGYLFCSTGVGNVCGLVGLLAKEVLDDDPTKDKFTFNYTYKAVSDMPDHQILEIVWTKTTEASRELSVDIRIYDDSALGVKSIMYKEGPSPIRFEFTKEQLWSWRNASTDKQMRVAVFPALTGAAIQQEFVGYRSDFFLEEPPAGWSYKPSS